MKFWQGSLVRQGLQLYTAVGWGWTLCSMFKWSHYQGSLVRYGLHLCTAIGHCHWLDSSSGQGHRLCSAIRLWYRLGSVAKQYCRLCSKAAPALFNFPGQAGPEFMFHSCAELLTWLPASVRLQDGLHCFSESLASLPGQAGLESILTRWVSLRLAYLSRWDHQLGSANGQSHWLGSLLRHHCQ